MSEEAILKLAAAEINLVLHATEDEDKVLKAIEATLLVPSVRFSRSVSEGHYKNKILMQKAMLSSKEAAMLAKRVISLLNSADRAYLSRQIDDYADEKGNLYIRLDKQRICQGKVSLSETDAIRVRFKPIRRFRPSDSVQNYVGLFRPNDA
ncbi:MAG TPA: RNA-binding domain-containing protein [Nitrososphaera sp.]|jgi:RNA-binding protein|nr:RNA-binding domain-containing protein [Nitrososphaera sp.]